MTGRDEADTGSPVLAWMALLLWLICVASAVGIVFSTYSARLSLNELEVLKREASGLNVLSGQYMLEKSVWASYTRVEKMAIDELHMSVPDTENTILVLGVKN